MDGFKNNAPRALPFPKWNGSSLTGKRILVHAEQGIGDEIMFVSCLPDVLTRAGKVCLECDPRLAPLFRRSFPEAEIISSQKPDSFLHPETFPVDFRLPVSGLPRFFRQDFSSFPLHRGYLKADPERRKHWRRTLSSLEKPLNVGIAWRGGKEARSRSARSIPLSEWREIFAADHVNFINLQYGDHREEISQFHREDSGKLFSLEGLDPLTDLDDLAALVAELDLVISVDNSTVHLAGALATPAWCMLPSPSDWRWHQERQDSPWYPSVRLFRQDPSAPGDWDEVLQKIRTELFAFPSVKREPIEIPGEIPSPPLPSTKNLGANAADSKCTSGPRVFFLNDTSSWYHWGCSCTSLAIHRQLRDRGFSVSSAPIWRINNLSGLPASIDEFDNTRNLKNSRSSIRKSFGI